MQYEYEKEELQAKKLLFNKTIGKIAKKLRASPNILRFCHEHNLPESSMSRLEKGSSDLQITTICRLAHAHGMKCSDFIKLVEEELPEDFTF